MKKDDFENHPVRKHPLPNSKLKDYTNPIKPPLFALKRHGKMTQKTPEKVLPCILQMTYQGRVYRLNALTWFWMTSYDNHLNTLDAGVHVSPFLTFSSEYSCTYAWQKIADAIFDSIPFLDLDAVIKEFETLKKAHLKNKEKETAEKLLKKLNKTKSA